MKVTFEISDKAMKEAMRNANVTTKRAAVIAALEHYIRVRKESRLAFLEQRRKNRLRSKKGRSR